MATRCLILKEEKQVLKGIYCHNDGYPDWVGALLVNYYSTPKKVDSLINLGDISKLFKNLEPTSNDHSFDKPEKDVTVAYARDRGEEFENIQISKLQLEKFAKENWAEFVYIYNGKTWRVLELNTEGKLV